MSASIQASFLQEKEALPTDQPEKSINHNIEHDSNSDVSELYGHLNSQMDSLNHKRIICQAIGMCFLFVVLVLSASFFITGMSVYYLVDFGNVVRGPFIGQLVERLCYPKGDTTYCRGRVMAYQNENIYLSVDEYPSDSNVWPPSSEIPFFFNRRESELALLPIIRYNPIGIVISSATIFGIVLLLVLTIVGIVFGYLASKRRKKVKYYEKSSSSWIKSAEKKEQPETTTTENQPILEITAHKKYDQ